MLLLDYSVPFFKNMTYDIYGGPTSTIKSVFLGGAFGGSTRLGDPSGLDLGWSILYVLLVLRFRGQRKVQSRKCRDQSSALLIGSPQQKQWVWMVLEWLLFAFSGCHQTLARLVNAPDQSGKTSGIWGKNGAFQNILKNFKKSFGKNFKKSFGGGL